MIYVMWVRLYGNAIVKNNVCQPHGILNRIHPKRNIRCETDPGFPTPGVRMTVVYTNSLKLEEGVLFVQPDASSEHPGRFGLSHINLHRGRGPEAEGSLEEVPVSTGPYIVFAQNACRPSARQKTLRKRFQSRLHICLVWSHRKS